MATTTYQDIVKNKHNLAPSQMGSLITPNRNQYFIRDLLSRKLKSSDSGKEVGSVNYILKSPKFFIRTKALQKESFLPLIAEETTKPIRPQVFIDFALKDGDILICKDSGIGEVVILDQDLPNHTISSALCKLPIQKDKYYLFAFLKHKYFLSQLNLMAPKGATIRHSKTLFLDCKIPYPNQKNKDGVISYVELLTQAIINKEKEIKKNHRQIIDEIEKEIMENQKDNEFEYEEVNFKELKKHLRLDVGLYGEIYKKLKFLVKNYKHGQTNIKNLDFKSKRGQNLQVSYIGKSIYSKNPKENFYKLITSSDLTGYGTHNEYRYLGNSKKLLLVNHGDIMFSATGQAHTSVGKVCVFINPPKKLISNINSFFFHKENFNLRENIFISCFFTFLKIKGYFVEIIGKGNGGSFTEKHFPFVNIPNFPKPKQRKIASLYHNVNTYPTNLDLKNFLSEDQKWNKKSGIIEIDKSMKKMKSHLNDVLDDIVNDKAIKLKFNI